MTRPAACGCCFILPPRLLRDLAAGRRLQPSNPQMFADTLEMTNALSAGRPNAGIGGGIGGGGGAGAQLPPDVVIAPDILQGSPTHLFDCAGSTMLPGNPVVALPPVGAAASVAATTADVLRFYATVLGRDSIDRAGAPVFSSLNYGQSFQNAYWSGQVMVYGNGDQQILTDFWGAPDVICHEITHGVTQHESGLVYAGEAGAVNESISDCFAAAFSQWRGQLPATDPSGWRLGAAILGPAARARGFTCLRDMASPTASHCLMYQPSLYPNIDDDDVHRNSGVPNRAFCLFARALGGNAYDAPIKLWYSACTAQGLTANATIADWAAATLRAAAAWTGPDKDALGNALANAWKTVDVTPTA